MTEPKRLLELGLPPSIGAVLESAEGDQPTAKAEERALRAIGLGTVGLAMGVPAMAEMGWRTKWSGKLTRLSRLKWIGIAAIPAAAAASTYFEARSTTEVRRPAAAVTVSPMPGAGPSAVALAVEAPLPPPTSAISATPAVSTRVNPTPEPAPSAKNTVERELALLDECRRSLLKGDNATALRQLEAYRKVFAHGALTTEATLLRIQALAASGRSVEAQELAAGVDPKHPDSPLAKRSRRLAGTRSP